MQFPMCFVRRVWILELRAKVSPALVRIASVKVLCASAALLNAHAAGVERQRLAFCSQSCHKVPVLSCGVTREDTRPASPAITPTLILPTCACISAVPQPRAGGCRSPSKPRVGALPCPCLWRPLRKATLGSSVGTRSRAVTQGRASPGTRRGLHGLCMLVWPCWGRLLAAGAGSHSHGHARAGHSLLCATHTSKWRVCACRCVLCAPQGWWWVPVPGLAPRAALHCRPGWLLGSVSP